MHRETKSNTERDGDINDWYNSSGPYNREIRKRSEVRYSSESSTAKWQCQYS